MSKLLRQVVGGRSSKGQEALIQQLEALAGLKSINFPVNIKGVALLPDTNFFYYADAYRMLLDYEPTIYVSDCARDELVNKVNQDLNRVKEHHDLRERMMACLAYHQYLSLASFSRSLPIKAEEGYCDKEIVNEYLDHLYTKMYLVTNDEDVVENVNNLGQVRLVNPPLSIEYKEPTYERSLGTYALFKMIGILIYFSRGEMKALIGGKRGGEYVEVQIQLPTDKVHDRNLTCDKFYKEMFKVDIIR